MSTTTATVKVAVSLFEKACVYMVNQILRIGLRLEHCRLPGGHYMQDYLEVITRGLTVWVTEMTLEKVYFELYSPTTNEAYERCEVPIAYIDDPTEEVVKVKMEELEAFLGRLGQLAPDAKFGVFVSVKAGHSEVPGWQMGERLKDFAGGVKEEHEIGTEHGYGPVKGRMKYSVSNWQQGRQDA